MQPSQHKNLLGLELLRFLSAVGVVFWHYQHFFMHGSQIDPGFVRAAQPLYPAFAFFYEQGHHSVELFWLISGYIFFWKYHQAVHTRAVDGWAFFVMRFSRLYPLHLLTLLAVALLQIAYRAGHGGADFAFAANSWHDFALQLAFASNWGFEINTLSFNGPIWSVSREIVIYAVFFLVSRLVLTRFAGRILLLGLAGTLWLANDRFGGFAAGRVFLTVSVYFFAGGLIQAIAIAAPARLLKAAAPVAALAALALVVFVFRNDDGTPKGAVLAAASLTLIAFLGLEEWPFAKPALVRLAPLADMTYSSYLLHFPIQLVMVLAVDALGLGRGLFLSPVALGVFFAAVFGLARLAFDRFERPAQDVIRRRLLAPRPAPAGASLPPA
jgi:peptidoglycan/LPS O-acetylase OafA/YrhL